MARGNRRNEWLAVAACLVLVKAVHLFGFYVLSDRLVWTDTPGAFEMGSPMLRWDSGWYRGIAEGGYAVPPDFPASEANVAFFPAYPLLARAAGALFGLSTNGALLAVAHVVGLLGLVAAYLVFRKLDRDAALPALLLFGLFPGNIALSAGYSECVFLLLFSLCLLASLSRRHVSAAVFVGLLSATRPQGVIGIAVLALGVLTDDGLSRRKRIALLAAGVPVGLAGLFAYMVFLSNRFGDPLAFVHAQNAWTPFAGGSGLATQLRFIPYLHNLKHLWTHSDPPNTIRIAASLFACFLALSAYGLVRKNPRWVVLVGLALLLIPYFGTAGQDYRAFLRYLGMVVPVFWLLGAAVAGSPALTAVTAAVFAVSSAIVAAEFANWYWVF